MSNSKEYKGRCFCGAVEISVVGEPAAAGYCHCDSCRHWSASPVNGFTLWPPSAVSVVRGKELVGSFQKTERSIRKWCTKCGGHLFTEHPHWNLIDVYAAVLPGLRFEPKLHVNYGEKVVPISDGLPKMKDLPSEMGGSGQTMPE